MSENYDVLKVFARAILLHNSTKTFASVTEFSKDVSGIHEEYIKHIFNDFYFSKSKISIPDI